jgi:hypothetical protein
VSLLLGRDELLARRAAASGGLAPLADGLAIELDPLREARVFIPSEKAGLTRGGGVCPRDGAKLEFDPWSPREHRCPQCGGRERGDAHYRNWITSYQLWLAERAVHAALLFALRGDERHRALAAEILCGYVASYREYPNRDNALGPTRVFFSTYLESIWLLQLCIALDLLETAGDGAELSGEVRDRLIEPSASLIASFDEGLSNRQVWNDAALLAAGRLLDDEALVRRAMEPPSGVLAHLAHGLLADGSWYEGENYHLFAHRGLWYLVTMATHAGWTMPASLLARFDEGFVAPFLTALPDFTLPARRDSQYAIALRQPRFAELAELGLARRDDPRLRAALHAIYSGDARRGDTGRARSTADVERNLPATALTRADLGWRSLLFARESLPELHPEPGRSVLLEGQGVAVLRRDDGRLYAALDYGHSGGGHGHPDRLNLLLADGATRWLDDPGTGSYVERTLHWYRSTLAHDAPLIDGRSQWRVHGRLRAFEERGAAGWVDADVEGIAPGAVARRSLVAMPDYVVDRLEWRADRPVRLDLPLHVDGSVAGVASWRPATLEGGDGLEDGFDFLRESAVALWGTGSGGDAGARLTSGPIELALRQGGAEASAWVLPRGPVELWRATAPGTPGSPDSRFHLVRAAGAAGAVTTVWDPRRVIERVELRDGTAIVTRRDGSRHEHGPTTEGWRIALHTGGARSSIDLGGLRPTPPAHRAPSRDTGRVRREPAAFAIPRNAREDWHFEHGAGQSRDWLQFSLGKSHYRRSEQSWREAGAPTATVALARRGESLVIEVDVRKEGAPVFRARDGRNELDNERADVNSDGLQLYLRSQLTTAGWLGVPDQGGALRIHEITGLAAGWCPGSEWRPRPGGWAARLTIPVARVGERFALDLIVNEISPDRERRRGQLVLSGGEDGWVYLRGDRHPLHRLLPFVLADA